MTTLSDVQHSFLNFQEPEIGRNNERDTAKVHISDCDNSSVSELLAC
jgi:hypothetical protein